MNEKIRLDFPLLQRHLPAGPVIYLDSAATSLKPNSVLAAERKYSTHFTANIHRGKHALSEEASVAYENARATVAGFVGAPSASVVFLKNTTEAINLVAHGLNLTKEDIVLLPISEHHSNILPWMERATVRWIEYDPVRPLTLKQVSEAIDKYKPKVLAFAQVSHVCGTIQPAAEICRLARGQGILTCVDAAQSMAHMRVDVAEMECDYLAFSGHKMLGPSGIGVLTGESRALNRLRPLILGGGCPERVTATDFTLKAVPYRFEAGTPNISGALGLAAAVEYLEAVGMEPIQAHGLKVANHLADVLKSLKGLKILMAEGDADRSPLASLAPLSRTVSPDQLAVTLSDGFSIMTRSGFFCAHPLFDFLKLDLGALRVSASIYTTLEEIDAFGTTMEGLLKKFGK